MSLIQVTGIPFRKGIVGGVETYLSDVGNIRLIVYDLSLLNGGPIAIFNSLISSKVTYEYSMNLPAKVSTEPHPTIPDCFVLTADPLGVLMIAKQTMPGVFGNGQILSVTPYSLVPNHQHFTFSFQLGGITSKSTRSDLQGIVFFDKFNTLVPVTYAHTVNSKLIINKKDIEYTNEIRYGAEPIADNKDSFVVENEVEMLALKIDKSDQCYRRDLLTNFINITGNNTSMADWEAIAGTDILQMQTIAAEVVSSSVPTMIASGLATTRKHISKFIWRSAEGVNSSIVDQHELERYNTYWCTVEYHHDILPNDQLTLAVSCAEPNITVIPLDSLGNYRIEIGNVDFAGGMTKAIDFTITLDDDSNTPISRTCQVTVNHGPFIMGMLGLNNTEILTSVTCDATNQIICVGTTSSLGSGISDGLIAKYSNNLELIKSVVLGGSSEDFFKDVAINNEGDMVCVGYTRSYGSGRFDALISKLNPTLDIIYKGTYGGSNDDYFSAVAIDSNDRIICVGYTRSEGVRYFDALIVIFDSNMNVITKKVYGGDWYDYFNDIVLTPTDEIICVGHTQNSGSSNDSILVKFDTNLNIIFAKKYSTINSNDDFASVDIDTTGNIYVSGVSGTTGVIVKFDASGNVLLDRRITYGTDCKFNSIKVVQNRIIVAGEITPTVGAIQSILADLTPTLTISRIATYGGSANDSLNDVATDEYGNAICVGFSRSDGQGGEDGLYIRWNASEDLPTGIYGGRRLPRLTYTEVSATITDGIATVSNLTLTLANSNLTYQIASLTLAKVEMTSVIDKIYP